MYEKKEREREQNIYGIFKIYIQQLLEKKKKTNYHLEN